MPKTRGRKKVGARGIPSAPAKRNTDAQQPALAARQPALPMQGSQAMLMSGLVVLGCLGLAFTFIFLSTDPNHYLFGGLASVMAVMWFISFGARYRKWQQSKRSRQA